MTSGKTLESWRIAALPSLRSISMKASGVVAGGMNMRAASTLTPSGTVRWAHGSITVLTLGTTMPRRARRPSPSRNRLVIGGAPSESREQLGEAVELVVDAVHAAGVPVGRHIDADHRLVEPAFGLVGEPGHRQVGAELHDRLDIGPIDRLDRLDHVARCQHGIGGRVLAAHVVEADDLIAVRPQHAPEARLDRRIVGLHDGDLLLHTMALQCLDHGIAG